MKHLVVGIKLVVLFFFFTNAISALAQCPNPALLIVLPDTSVAFETDSIELDAGPDAITYQWNTGATTRKIKVGQNGKYKVTVTLNGGVCGTDSTQVFFLKGLTIKDTSVCPGSSVVLALKNAFDKVEWSDGKTGNTDTITVTTNSTHTCLLKFGKYTFTDTIHLHLHPLPDISLKFSRRAFCVYDTMLTVSCNPSAVNQWFVNDTMVFTGKTFQLKKTGTVHMLAINQFGCVQVSPPFTIGNATPFKARTGTLAKEKYCEGDTISFSDSSALDTSFYHRLWRFDDNSFSVEKNPQHVYNESNIYKVSLSYTDSFGCKDSTINPTKVLYNPIAYFSTQRIFSDTIGLFYCYNDRFGIKDYNWTLDVGNIIYGLGTRFIKIYIPVKIGIVSLLVFDSNGCSDSFSDTLYNYFGAINNSTKQTQLELYPNPGNGSFTIHHESLQGDNAMLEIYNLMGELVYKENVVLNQTIHTNLNNGIYIVRMTHQDQSYITKLVIQKEQ